jgi:hypothetical protein
MLFIDPLIRLFSGNHEKVPPFIAYFTTRLFEGFETKSHWEIRRILSNGRKAMATITDIQYIGCPPETKNISNTFYTVTDKLNRKPDLNKPYYIGCVAAGITFFKLTYTFNPPDDATDEDLVHSVTVPFDPSLSFKIGDMLPILYEFNPESPHIVRSMPFPYPLQKIYKLSDIYCETNCNIRN